MTKFISDESGFSLVEVLIALVIFAVGFLGVASMQQTSITGNSQANRISESMGWGVDRIEAQMGLDFTAAATDPDLVATVPDTTTYAAMDAALDNLATARQVTEDNYDILWNVADDYPIDNCKTIRVHIRRNDKGVQKVVSMDFAKMRTL